MPETIQKGGKNRCTHGEAQQSVLEAITHFAVGGLSPKRGEVEQF
jgi:hypothetical protein